MINRVLIRIRVLQILYSYYANQDSSVKKAESDLFFSFQKSYDLYFYLLLLLVELTDSYSKKIEMNKSKLLPTEEDLNPNTRLIDNRFVKSLRGNEAYTQYIKERPFSWHDHDVFLKSLLNKILNSDIYSDYISSPNTDFDADREFWRKVFKQIICKDDELESLLEDESLFWNDDIEIVESFVLKTIKKFNENNNNHVLLPMFREEDDRVFAVKLLRESIMNGKEYREIITEYAQNWESERIASMDLIIMQIAIAELMHFPSIPVSVTLNEYIDISKSYSTEKSASFINGILDPIVVKLRSEKKLIK